MEPITEKLSEKPKRGRPADPYRETADFVTSELGYRGKLNTACWVRFMGAVLKHPEDIQKLAMGATGSEVMAGANHARGFRTASIEAARFLNSTGWENASDVVLAFAESRRDGVAYKHIAAHYRQLRLGPREGNTYALLAVLSRAFDDYMRNFPATTPEAQKDAIEALLQIVTDMQDDTTSHGSHPV